MSELNEKSLQTYLEFHYDTPVNIIDIEPLGGMDEVEFLLKDYGYGTPLRINFTSKGVSKTIVLNTVKPGPFGHQTMPDRAEILLRQYQAFNQLQRHVKALDVGAFTKSGSIISIGDVEELFLITEHVEGKEYFRDLDRIKTDGEASPLDFNRATILAEYLSEIHSEKHEDPKYYERRTRELIGHNECIMGLMDSYPMDHDWITTKFLSNIEKKTIDWRWHLKKLTHRLSTVHGDFHPFNILFRKGTDFTALDRSRGERGEPADDIAGLTINYLFWGLLKDKEFKGPFKELWETFYETYLENTSDEEMLTVIPPYLTWRAVIVASPVWYPHYSMDIRKKLLNFASNILYESALDPYEVDHLLEEK
ncbi:aminoglycoside phosphotransferase family protein [Candidatus Bathyarchaeota archaeon]|nr:aminoglycoside phosphotransferase family protein [Candidatus Bathyarchaeota archaeon]